MATFSRGSTFQSDLFQKKVLMPYLQEYLNNTQFSNFMGDSNSIIYRKFQSKGEGDVIIYPTRQAFMPNAKTGYDQLEGAESELTYVADKITIGRFRFATLLTDLQMMELQTKFQLSSDVRNDLLNQASLLNTRRIITAFALSFSPSAYAGNNLISPNIDYTALPGIILAAQVDNPTVDHISSSRVVFGDENNNGANAGNRVVPTVNTSIFNHLTTAGTGFQITQNNMGVAHIYQLVKLAQMGSRIGVQNKEAAIRPYKTMGARNGFVDNRYILFISPDAYNRLRQDTAWQAQVSRGIIENENQPSVLYGSMYKGTIEGVMVIVVPELASLTVTGTGGAAANYSIFCGASAMAYAMGSVPTFTERSSTDYGLYSGIAHNEISAFKVLKYPSKGNLKTKGNNNLLVDNGIIHSFTATA